MTIEIITESVKLGIAGFSVGILGYIFNRFVNGVLDNMKETKHEVSKALDKTTEALDRLSHAFYDGYNINRVRKRKR